MKTNLLAWHLPAVMLVALLVIGLGTWFYVAQNQSAGRGAERQLTSIAQLKVSQISGWRSHLRDDAAAMAANPVFVDFVERWLSSRDSVGENDILAWFRTVQNRAHYSDIGFVDPRGQVLIGLNRHGALGPATLGAFQAALVARTVVLTDLHRDADGNRIKIEAISPLYSGSENTGELIGAVVLSADAGQFLFPLVQSWPVDSRSAETLLVRRDGERVLFLNDLRGVEGAALSLTFPLTQSDLPAAQAVLGRRGVFAGTDYRGASVITALEPVPNSPWFMVAKIDTSEALGGARVRSGLIPGLIAVLLLGMAGAGWAHWQLRQKQLYEEAYENEAKQRAILARFEYLLMQANDAIILSGKEGRILEVNDKALEMYGYSREQLLSLCRCDLVPVDGQVALGARVRKLFQKGSFMVETEHVRKDGTPFPVEVSGRRIEIDGEPCVHAIIRDVTARKQTEEALRLTQLSVDTAAEMIHWIAPDGRLLYVSDSTCRRHGYSREELLGMTIFDLDPSISPKWWPKRWEKNKERKERGSFVVESVHRAKDGEVFPVEVVVNYVRCNGQEYDFAYARDISERKQAEKVIRESEEQLRQAHKMQAIGRLAGGDCSRLQQLAYRHHGQQLAGAHQTRSDRPESRTGH